MEMYLHPQYVPWLLSSYCLPASSLATCKCFCSHRHRAALSSPHCPHGWTAAQLARDSLDIKEWLLLLSFLQNKQTNKKNYTAFYAYPEWTTIVNAPGFSETWRKWKENHHWWGKVENQESGKEAEVEAGGCGCTTIIYKYFISSFTVCLTLLVCEVSKPDKSESN